MLSAQPFRSPIGHETRLSGSYGEPRTAHFHAGIDYKQYRGVPRDTIYSVAEGHISRISVMPDGYGNALYIDHPNGYTSVYAHLYDFSPDIRSHIDSILYSKKIHKLNYTVPDSSHRVKAGQYIGIMGNTGRSSAAHLHFEIRNTDTEIPVNPSRFGFKPKDTQRPTINGVILYELTPDGEQLTKNYYPVTYRGNGEYTLTQDIIQTDAIAIGLGLHCYDTMNGANNHNGIYGLKMQLNGRDHYAFELNEVSFENSRYIHAHMDYEAKKNKKYYSTCFRTAQNPLQIYDEKLSDGIIYPIAFMPSEISITAYDYDQNESTVQFKLIGSDAKAAIKRRYDSSYSRLSPHDSTTMQAGQYTIEIPSGAVERPHYIRCIADAETLYIESPEPIPLFKYFKITAEIDSINQHHKAVFTKVNDKGEIVSLGAKKEKGNNLVTFVNEVGSYELSIDTEAPTITIVSLPKGDYRRIAFQMEDNYKEAYSKDYMRYELIVDGQWKLCQHDIKSNKVWHDLTIPQENKEHTLTIKVKDSVGNESIETRRFIY